MANTTGYLAGHNEHAYYSGSDLDQYYGNYQFINLSDIVDNFIATYVGSGKILENALAADVSFHAHRALAELSFDTFKSCKSQEITLPPSLTMPLPIDYVNYTKITWSDGNGIEHVIYPASKTSNPNSVMQDSDGKYMFSPQKLERNQRMADRLHQYERTITITSLSIGQVKWDIFPHSLGWKPEDSFGVANNVDTNPLKVGMEIVSPHFPAGTTISKVYDMTDTTNWAFETSNPTLVASPINVPTLIHIIDNTSDTTWGKFKSSSSNQVAIDNSLTTNPSVDNDNYFQSAGQRYGLDPQYAQGNGSFFIDCDAGKVHFSSNLNGKTIILHYLSDSLGSDDEMKVHKFAEEAIYKWIAYGCLSALADVPEYIIARFKREKFAETRKAKLRLSNIKIEEITQIFRGKSKFIKH